MEPFMVKGKILDGGGGLTVQSGPNINVWIEKKNITIKYILLALCCRQVGFEEHFDFGHDNHNLVYNLLEEVPNDRSISNMDSDCRHWIHFPNVWQCNSLKNMY